MCHRDVARPSILLRYFDQSNAVDVNNQVRQGNLALEECWVTGNGWFRLFTTFIGWTVTDTWCLRTDKSKRENKEEHQSWIVEFAGNLSELLVKIAMEMERAQEGEEDHSAIVNVESTESTVSLLTNGTSNEHKHKQEYLSYQKSQPLQRNGKKAPSQARCMWCSRVKGIVRKTQLQCVQCGVGFFAEKSGRKFWSLHVCNNGPPPKPQPQRSKRSKTSNIVSVTD